MKKTSQAGFTLIELLVVVAILAVLAAVAVPRVLSSLTDARSKTDEANIAILQSAVERWSIDKNPGGTAADWVNVLYTTHGGSTRPASSAIVNDAKFYIDEAALAIYVSKWPSHPTKQYYVTVKSITTGVFGLTVGSENK